MKMQRVISKEFALVFLTSFFVVTSASAQKINYKTAKLVCTFTHHCYEGRNMKILADRRIDFSNCANVDIPMSWDPSSSTITFNNKKLPVLSTRSKRKNISVNTKVGSSFVKFAASPRVWTLSFRGEPKVNSPITDFYDGQCEVAK
ncbi:MAG: hypothetical protein ACI84R_002882 [Candidatus Azotimanducaceae bacterium]|jgi:hypothetical protein